MGKEIIRGWHSDHSISLLRRDGRHTDAVKQRQRPLPVASGNNFICGIANICSKSFTTHFFLTNVRDQLCVILFCFSAFLVFKSPNLPVSTTGGKITTT